MVARVNPRDCRDRVRGDAIEMVESRTKPRVLDAGGGQEPLGLVVPDGVDRDPALADRSSTRISTRPL